MSDLSPARRRVFGIGAFVVVTITAYYVEALSPVVQGVLYALGIAAMVAALSDRAWQLVPRTITAGGALYMAGASTAVTGFLQLAVSAGVMPPLIRAEPQLAPSAWLSLAFISVVISRRLAIAETKELRDILDRSQVSGITEPPQPQRVFGTTTALPPTPIAGSVGGPPVEAPIPEKRARVIQREPVREPENLEWDDLTHVQQGKLDRFRWEGPTLSMKLDSETDLLERNGFIKRVATVTRWKGNFQLTDKAIEALEQAGPPRRRSWD